jgi:hypothetical protein
MEIQAYYASQRGFGSVHVLVRRTPPDIAAGEKLKIHEIDFARLPAALPTVDDVFIVLGTTIKIADAAGRPDRLGTTSAQQRNMGGKVARAARLDGCHALHWEALNRLLMKS